VTTDGPEPRVSLLDAARVLAHGRDLDSKLRALAGHARDTSGAAAAVMLIWDPETEALSDATGDEVGDAHMPSSLAQALAERAPNWNAPVGALSTQLGGATQGAVIPLVVEDELGAQAEGLLVLSASGSEPDSGAQEALLALADLAAVAIRQARLHNALAERAEYLERLGRTDGLTGLADRRTFDQMLELELARADRQGTPLAVVFFDLDGFTEFRQRLGSRAGDDALRAVASTLADRVRLVDTVARIGDDEFAVIAPGDPSGIVARRVLDAVAALPPVGAERVSISAGVAHHPRDGTTAEALVARAEQRIAEAQSKGPGSIAGGSEAAR
jgi:diguanylate cyclase (GGDEF)-like protein